MSAARFSTRIPTWVSSGVITIPVSTGSIRRAGTLRQEAQACWRALGGDGRYLAALSWSDSFSATMITVRLVLALGTAGLIEASATRNPSTPMTRHCGSTTAIRSVAAPILQGQDGG